MRIFTIFLERRLGIYAVMFILLLSGLQSFGQELGVSGTVLDQETNEALPGVTVLVKGTSTGTVTDIDGNYRLSVSADAVLAFSFVGYNLKEIPVNNQSVIDVTLSANLTSLEEVVVVGYGTQNKSDLTGSLISVGSKELADVPAAVDFSSALKGRMAGVNIQTTSSRPGAGTQIRIRGNRSLGSDESGVNDPLIVLDGIPYGGKISDINPGDIKSVNVLKDASATAIYGSRGANGVILVTTKRGENGAPRLSYNGYHGVVSELDHYELFNAEEYANIKQVSNFGKVGGQFTPTELQSMAEGRETDWQDLIYKRGIISNHEVSLTGGTPSTQYAISGGYFKQSTVLPGQDYSRLNLRTALDQEVGARVKVGLTSMSNLATTNGEGANPMFQILTLSPLYNAYTDGGEINELPAVGSVEENLRNPLLMYRENSWSQKRRRLQTFNSLYGEIEILDGLKYRLNVGLDFWQEEYGDFYGANTPFRNGSGNTGSVRNQDSWSYTLENLLVYDKTFGAHKINLTGLYSVQERETNQSGVNANSIFAEFLEYYNLSLAETQNVPDGAFSYSRWGLVSGMARLNYGFQDRFNATVTVRSDGSSRLSEGNKWFVYPAGALSWNLHNESFMSGMTFITNLKLRTGLGRTSNQAVNPYDALGSLERRRYNYGDDGAYGFLVQSLPNANLAWEFTTSSNVGIDFGLFTNLITGSLDFYKNNTDNVLQSRNLPVTSGVPGSFRQNIGKTEGKGVELMLSATIVEPKNNGFGWNVDFNFTAHKETIVELYDTLTRDVNNGWFVGSPVNVIYDYKKTGVWQLGEEDAATAFDNRSPGDIKVADINGNGIRDTEDRTILGQLDPKSTYGFTSRFSYQGFDLSTVLFARVGGKLVSTLYQMRAGNPVNSLEGRRNGPKVDYWTPDNPTNDYPRTGNQQTQHGSTTGYFNASYLKVRSINLGYKIPDKLLEDYGIQSLRVYFTVDTPFKAFFSDYVREGGLDPEPSGRDGATDTPGLGRRLVVTPNTPVTRSFIFGVNLTL
ncbi:SusC/RagA family TonB-linked outer membrane protein [Marinoscillum sp.]|uniref:SusC/RagA family TonB-linked outer membrane protein n=1 Tax=Marinoscillum sp. TaxID=2024838 RepID=UPI003BA8C885